MLVRSSLSLESNYRFYHVKRYANHNICSSYAIARTISFRNDYYQRMQSSSVEDPEQGIS